MTSALEWPKLTILAIHLGELLAGRLHPFVHPTPI
jgi:hypothetical protein